MWIQAISFLSKIYKILTSENQADIQIKMYKNNYYIWEKMEWEILIETKKNISYNKITLGLVWIRSKKGSKNWTDLLYDKEIILSESSSINDWWLKKFNFSFDSPRHEAPKEYVEFFNKTKENQWVKFLSTISDLWFIWMNFQTKWKIHVKIEKKGFNIYESENIILLNHDWNTLTEGDFRKYSWTDF